MKFARVPDGETGFVTDIDKSRDANYAVAIVLTTKRGRQRFFSGFGPVVRGSPRVFTCWSLVGAQLFKHRRLKATLTELAAQGLNFRTVEVVVNDPAKLLGAYVGPRRGTNGR